MFFFLGKCQMCLILAPILHSWHRCPCISPSGRHISYSQYPRKKRECHMLVIAVCSSDWYCSDTIFCFKFLQKGSHNTHFCFPQVVMIFSWSWKYTLSLFASTQLLTYFNPSSLLMRWRGSAQKKHCSLEWPMSLITTRTTSFLQNGLEGWKS